MQDTARTDNFPTFRALFRIIGWPLRWLFRVFRRPLKPLLVLVSLWLLATLITWWRVSAEISRIRAKGEPTSLSHYKRPPVPDSENGAIPLQKAIDTLKAFPQDCWAWADVEFAGGNNKNDTVPKNWGLARETLAKYRPAVIPLVEQALTKNEFRFSPITTDVYDYLFDFGLLTGFLRANALVDAHDGNISGALHCLELEVGLDKTMRSDPSKVVLNIRCNKLRHAIRSIQCVCGYASFGEEPGRRLCDLLAGIELEKAYLASLKSVRAALMDRFADIRRHGPKALDVYGEDISTWCKFTCTPLGLPMLNNDELNCLRLMDWAIANANVPYRARTYRERDYLQYPSLLELSASMVRSFRAMIDERSAALQLAQASLALQAYKDHYHAYPASLDELNAKLAWNLNLEDPFSGKQFAYRRQGSGFVLYSIGADLNDDGGKSESEDIVWKMDN